MTRTLIVVISLKSSADRRQYAVSQLRSIEHEWQFLDAIDSRTLNLDECVYPRDRVRRLLGFELTKNEIACFLSHRETWKLSTALKRPVLVLEDDFVLTDLFQRAFSVIDECADDIGFCRLQALDESTPLESVDVIENFTISVPKRDPLGAAGYFVTPEIAQVLIDHSKAVFEPLDHFIEHTAFHGLRLKALTPYPIKVSGYSSTIGDRENGRRIRGINKLRRSVFRAFDRIVSEKPWF